MSEYEKAMLIMAKAQLRLLAQIGCQTSRTMEGANNVDRIIELAEQETARNALSLTPLLLPYWEG